MDVGAAFVADEQPFHLVEPGEGAFDDPAIAAQAGAVLGVAAGNHGLDATLAKAATVRVRVVAAVCDHAAGSLARTACQAGDGGNGVDERQQLADVVAVAAGQRPRQRDATSVGQEMVLGARAAPIDRARARFGAPFIACIWLESTIARDHSISPAAGNWVSNTACSLSQTPARCHSSSRRQHVKPEPYPNSCGRCIQALPVCNTNKIPHNASLSDNRFRPG